MRTFITALCLMLLINTLTHGQELKAVAITEIAKPAAEAPKPLPPDTKALAHVTVGSVCEDSLDTTTGTFNVTAGGKSYNFVGPRVIGKGHHAVTNAKLIAERAVDATAASYKRTVDAAEKEPPQVCAPAPKPVAVTPICYTIDHCGKYWKWCTTKGAWIPYKP